MDKPYIDILFMGKGGSSKSTAASSGDTETSESIVQHDCFCLFGDLILTAEIPDIISAVPVLTQTDSGSINAEIHFSEDVYNDYILGEMSEVE